jgi:hypothetical protein
MKIASHNSFTYLPIKHWYHKPLAFLARCQKLDIWGQYAYGVKVFDLRVRFTKNGSPIICHGVVEFKHDIHFIDSILVKLNNCKGISVRILLEMHNATPTQASQFRRFCKRLEETYSKINFFGGNSKGNPIPLYNFNSKYLHLVTGYNAVPFPKKSVAALNRYMVNKEAEGYALLDYVNLR